MDVWVSRRKVFALSAAAADQSGDQAWEAQ
jgi:hypothetical protein